MCLCVAGDLYSMFLTFVPLRCFHICVLICPRGQMADILTPMFQMEKKKQEKKKNEDLVTKHLANVIEVSN